MGFDTERYISDRKKFIDQKLSEIVPVHAKSPSSLEESMRYSLLASGKRLRPILCLAAGEAVGGTVEMVISTACAIEMIHTYSLIHDDLPSMDDDSLRRGVPTNHSVFGEALAILAGDALLTDAFLVIASEGISNGLSPSLVVEIIQDVANAAGSRGMVKGQALDLALEGKEKIDPGLIEKLHSLKTGALIEASVLSGGRLGGANEEQLFKLSKYAKCIGLSFQIIDDVLNIEGGTEIGKGRGTDARKKKATYPGLLGVE
ncbi:MAG: polyprenyl synthetase family protein, partial [Thermodesulfobacteriota bacterium]